MENMRRNARMGKPVEMFMTDAPPCEPSMYGSGSGSAGTGLPIDASNIDVDQMLKDAMSGISGGSYDDASASSDAELADVDVMKIQQMMKDLVENLIPARSEMGEDLEEALARSHMGDLGRMMKNDMPGNMMHIEQMMGDDPMAFEGLRMRMPNVAVHVLEVHMMPEEGEKGHHDHEDHHGPECLDAQAWNAIGIAVLITLAVLLGLLIIYLIIRRCCCRKPKESDVERDVTAIECRPEHRMSLPSELPPLGAADKSAPLPPPEPFLSQVEAFRAEAYLAQPYRADPGELAAAQERMLAQLNADPAKMDWDAHGDFDTQRLQ